MTGRRGRPLRGLLGIAVLLGGAATAAGSLASACVPQPYIVVQPRASGPAGTQVEVVGDNFEGVAVEIRWNRLDGELLGKANGPAFSLTVTIPDQAEGLYSLLAVSRGAQGEVGSIARAAFSLTGVNQPVIDEDPPASDVAGEEEGSSSSPIPAMLVGGALVAAGGGAGAAAVRFWGRRRVART